MSVTTEPRPDRREVIRPADVDPTRREPSPRQRVARPAVDTRPRDLEAEGRDR